MRSNERYAKAYEALVEQGRKLELALVFDLMPQEQSAGLAPAHKSFAKALHGLFRHEYHVWHENAASFIRGINPEKHEEFVSYSLANPTRKGAEQLAPALKGWLNGSLPEFPEFQGAKFFNGPGMVSAFFANQLRILCSCGPNGDAGISHGMELEQSVEA